MTKPILSRFFLPLPCTVLVQWSYYEPSVIAKEAMVSSLLFEILNKAKGIGFFRYAADHWNVIVSPSSHPTCLSKAKVKYIKNHIPKPSEKW